MKKISIAVIALVGLVACQQSKIAYIESSDLVNDYQEKKDIEAQVFKLKLMPMRRKEIVYHKHLK